MPGAEGNTQFLPSLGTRSPQVPSLRSDQRVTFPLPFPFFQGSLISSSILEEIVRTPSPHTPPSSMKQGWNFSKGTFTRKLKGNQTECKRTEAELQMGSGGSDL